MKSLFLSLSLLFFISFASSQDDEFFDIFEEQEDIACEDLPEAFKKYDEDRKLNQMAMESSLAQAIKSLKEISKQGSDNPEESIDQLTSQLEEALNWSQSNTLIFLNKSDNFSYFLTDCSPKKQE